MSWAEVKKINSNMNVPLDVLLTSVGKQVFTSDGTFVVPSTVHKVFITACGGGGGGAFGGYAGGNGTATVIGDLVTLAPGSFANQATPGAGAGNGGSGGAPGSKGEDANGVMGGRGGDIDTTTSPNIPGGGGGSLGNGGRGGGYATDGKYGGGGGGAYYPNTITARAGGGGADYIIRQEYSVTPGSSIAITVGTGGSNWEVSGYRSGKGGDGIVIIEWGYGA